MFPLSVGLTELPGILAGMFRTAMLCSSSTLAVVCPRLVLLIFPLALCSFLFVGLAHDALHHGWLWTRKTSCMFYWQWHVQGLVYWPLHLARCSSPWRVWQAQMFGILAGMNQKNRFAFCTVVHTPVVCNNKWPWLRGAENSQIPPQLQPIHKVVELPCRDTEFSCP